MELCLCAHMCVCACITVYMSCVCVHVIMHTCSQMVKMLFRFFVCFSCYLSSVLYWETADREKESMQEEKREGEEKRGRETE